MTVLITGAVAYDTVFTHDGRFEERLRGSDLSHLNTTFLTRGMRRDFGGCGANIAVAVRRLGGDPVLWGAVGADGGAYLERFAALGISTAGIGRFDDAYTAQCVIFTDAAGAQLAVFHPGAMDRSREVPWPRTAAGEALRPSWAVLAPGGRETTLNAARECAARGVPYLFDVGQELPLFSPEELTMLLEGAFGIAYSDYEAEAFARRTGIDARAAAKRGKVVLQTHGERGADLLLPGGAGPHFIEPLCVRAQSAVGAGDAMRGGFLFGLDRGLGFLEAARLGAVTAAAKVASPSAQDYPLTLERARRDYEGLWGAAPF